MLETYVNAKHYIPSSSLMDTIVEVGIDIIGPVGVTMSRPTVNSWSNSRLPSFTIPNVAQEVLPIISPLEKVTSRGDGAVKSSPSTAKKEKDI